jgi:hypothetical protein
LKHSTSLDGYTPLAILLLVVWSSYFYAGTEWLFLATKPSVLSGLSPSRRALALLGSPLLLSMAAAVPTIALLLLARAGGSRAPSLRWLPIGVPAALLTGAELLLIDNFTYTLLGFGVVTTAGFARFAYALWITALFIFNIRMLGRRLRQESWLLGRERSLLVFTSGLLVLSSIAVGLEFRPRAMSALAHGRSAEEPDPANVLIFSMDGVNAAHLSAYGAARQTTPFLDSLESLVFENHFTNSARTTGAIGALLSAKLPTTTRVIFPPDTFQGVHAYQHLPGLLRDYGYTTGDFTVRHYGDARDLNLREAFDWSMDRGSRWGELLVPGAVQRALPATSSFVNATLDRLGSRLLHAFGIREMENAYESVAAPHKGRSTDRKRVEALKEFLVAASLPFFAHAHLLSTHGPIFHSEHRIFSTDADASAPWLRAAQDDAILQMDRYLAEIWTLLEEEGLAGDTLLIVTSDHGYQWNTLTPVPLVLRLPGGVPVGVRTENSQRIDIAPTILDFLGIPRPEWIEGRSLLSEPLDPLAPIVTVGRAEVEEVDGWTLVANPQPPFYTLGQIFVTYCDVQYRMKLPGGQVDRLRIRSHTARCPASKIPSLPQARRFLIDHLAAARYDVSGLE